MNIYRIDPAPMSHSGLFATLEGAQRCADEQLAGWHELMRKETEEAEEEGDYWYPLTTELAWTWGSPDKRKWSDVIDPKRSLRLPSVLTAWYCSDYAFRIYEAEVHP